MLYVYKGTDIHECYISQPFAGYALRSHSKEEIIIVGVLIQKERFFKTFLPILSSNAALFRFFLDPNTNAFADEFIHLSFEEIAAMLGYHNSSNFYRTFKDNYHCSPREYLLAK